MALSNTPASVTATEQKITVRNVSKEYASGEDVIQALSGVSFSIEPEELCCVVGPSGSG